MPQPPYVRAVRDALDTGQIGTPVAARLFLAAAEHRAAVLPAAAGALAEVLSWLNGPLATVGAQGGTSAGHVTVLAKTEHGRSALVSIGVGGAQATSDEIVVFGNRGILSWEADGDPEVEQLAAQSSVAAQRLQVIIESALTSGSSVDITEHGTHPRGVQSSAPTSTAPLRPLPAPKALAPPYGVLLVGGDHTHQSNYAVALAADRRCQLIGLADENGLPKRRLDLNARLAKRLGIANLPNLTEALQRDDVHVVSICAEPYRRGPIICQAAKARKHLYLDKPLAGTLPHADQIVAAAQNAGVVMHMFSQILSEPAAKVRRIIESGELGDLRAIHCDTCFAKGHAGTADLTRPRRESPAPSRYELPDAKREMTNVGVYPVAMMLWLLRRRVTSVFATTGNFFFAEHQENDMEDFAQILLQFDGAITASVSAGRTGWHSHPGFGLSRAYLLGTEGTVVVDAHRPRVEVWADAPPWKAPRRDPQDPMRMWFQLPKSPYKTRPKQRWITADANVWQLDAKHFLDCIEQGRQSEMPVDIAASATEVLLAAYQSAASGQVVELE